MTADDRIDVVLRCPACGHTWLSAVILPDTWWGKGLTPATCASRPYCPACQQPPPMLVVST